MGISSFDDDRFTAVPFAVDDAVDLAWVFALHLKLIDPSRTVLALAGEPRKAMSQERLAALLQAGAKQESAGYTRLHKSVLAVGRASGPRGLFVLTAATHGLSDQGGDYLVAADSGRDTLLETALKLPPLFDRIAQLPAKRRLVLLDACRERLTEQRSVGETDPAMTASFAAAISKAVGQTVLMSSVAGGYSYDDTKKKNGVFSGALVAGLCGSAKADADGLIKVGAVADYARERVQAFVREHRPEHECRSRGIEERYDENARELPLAIDPARTRALEAYRLRRAAAVEQLHRNIGGDLDGRRIEDIKDFLPTAGLPSAEVEEVLTEIEALDGSDRSKRNVLFLFLKLRTGGSRWDLTGMLRKWLVGAALAVPAFLLVGWLGFGGGERHQPGPAVSLGTGTRPLPQPQPTMQQGTHAEPKAGDRVLDSFGMAYRYIPGGVYTIGSPVTDKDRFDNEKQHQIAVKGFWLAETELTQAEWKRHGFANPSLFNTCADCPVEQVSWYEAVMFANELSRKADLELCYVPDSCPGVLGTFDYACVEVKSKKGDCSGYRLPTEEEWEVAARAQLPGTAYRARYGELDAIAWYVGNSGGKTQPVGQKDANEWGLRDMLGNVWEWTNSSWGTDRVYRGGSWFRDTRRVRAAFRVWGGPSVRDGRLGFRILVGRPLSDQEKEGRGAP